MFADQIENENNAEKEFEDSLLTPLLEHETEAETVNVDIEDIEEKAEPTKEEKKRTGRLNELGAKGIVKVVDIGFANFASYLACTEDTLKYRADEDAIEDLTAVVSEAIPSASGTELKIPLWAQIIIYTLIAFLPILFTAISDRRKNKDMQVYKKEIRRLKREKRILEMQKEQSKLENEMINRDQDKETSKKDNSEAKTYHI